MSDMISFSISLYMARKASLSVDDMIQWGRFIKASVLWVIISSSLVYVL